MLAQRTDEVIGEFIAFVDVTAYLAYPALLAFGLGLRLNLILIIGIGHGLLIGHDSGLGHFTYKHAVGIKVHILLYL